MTITAWAVQRYRSATSSGVRNLLPAITTSVIPMGIVTRTVRALTGDILSQDFVEFQIILGCPDAIEPGAGLE